MDDTSTYVAFRVQSLLFGTILCILGFAAAGAGLSCMDSRDGGRMPEPEAARAVCVAFSGLSAASFANSVRAARGITPARSTQFL